MRARRRADWEMVSKLVGVDNLDCAPAVLVVASDHLAVLKVAAEPVGKVNLRPTARLHLAVPQREEVALDLGDLRVAEDVVYAREKLGRGLLLLTEELPLLLLQK